MENPGKEGPILIAGGGIGGLTAGIALRQAGFDVQVFEKAGEIREIGAGIALSPNAVSALRRVGLDRAVTEAGVVAEDLNLRTSDGALLARLHPRDLGAGIDTPSSASTARPSRRNLTEPFLPFSLSLAGGGRWDYGNFPWSGHLVLEGRRGFADPASRAGIQIPARR